MCILNQRTESTPGPSAKPVEQYSFGLLELIVLFGVVFYVVGRYMRQNL